MHTNNSLRVGDLEAPDWPCVKPASGPASQAWKALELTSDGVMVLDEKAVIIHSNTRALTLLRCTLSDVSGCDFWEAVPAEIAEQHQEATDLALLSSVRHTFVAHQKFENTSLEYTFTRQSPGYVVNLREAGATARLQRQLDDSKRYNQLIFEANPNAMWVFD